MVFQVASNLECNSPHVTHFLWENAFLGFKYEFSGFYLYHDGAALRSYSSFLQFSSAESHRTYF